MCLGTFPRLRRSLATSTLYAAVRILASLNLTIYLNENRRFSFATRTTCLLVLTRSFTNIFFP